MLVRGSHRMLQFISRHGLPVPELQCPRKRPKWALSLGKEWDVKQRLLLQGKDVAQHQQSDAILQKNSLPSEMWRFAVLQQELANVSAEPTSSLARP